MVDAFSDDHAGRTLLKRLRKAGIDSIAVAAHPGAAVTNLSRHLECNLFVRILFPLVNRMMQSAAQGALPQIRAAVDPTIQGGEYYGPTGRMRGDPVRVESTPASHNRSDAERLWEVSQRLTGVSYL